MRFTIILVILWSFPIFASSSPFNSSIKWDHDSMPTTGALRLIEATNDLSPPERLKQQDQCKQFLLRVPVFTKLSQPIESFSSLQIKNSLDLILLDQINLIRNYGNAYLQNSELKFNEKQLVNSVRQMNDLSQVIIDINKLQSPRRKLRQHCISQKLGTRDFHFVYTSKISKDIVIRTPSKCIAEYSLLMNSLESDSNKFGSEDLYTVIELGKSSNIEGVSIYGGCIFRTTSNSNSAGLRTVIPQNFER